MANGFRSTDRRRERIGFTTCILIGLTLAWAPAVLRAQEKSEGELADARITRAPVRWAGGVAKVEFPIVCRERETQAYFNQAVVALHALDAKAADRAFYEAAMREPECAMAWWGLAMANIENHVLARHYLEKAAVRAARGPERERRWVTVLERYLQDGASEEDRRSHVVQSLSRMATENPEDHEAAAFLVRQLVSNREAGMPVPLVAAVDALIGQVLRERPEHPIAVYRLLLWEREQPQRVAEAIEQVRRLLPESPRVQTIAGRIYARLHRRTEAIACFTASLMLARKVMATERVGPLDVPGYVENLDLLITQLRIEGRVSEAVALARHLIELPSVAAVEENASNATTAGMERMGGGGVSVTPFASSNGEATTVAQRHLLGVLVEYQRWDELAVAAKSARLESTAPEVQGLRIHASGLGEFLSGNAAGLGSRQDALTRLLHEVRRDTAGHGVGAREALLSRLQALGRELQWCRELLERATMETGGSKVPLAARRTAMNYSGAGGMELAVAAARRRAEEPAASASVLLDLVQLLEHSGQPEAAQTQRAVLPRKFPFGDAGVIMDGSGQPSGPVSTGARLAVDLSPPMAPRWALSDQHGMRIESTQFEGRPTLLVFYRGAGCPHCIEQLVALAPLNIEFELAGITLIGVSTDTVAGLKESYSAVGATTALPFQLVSDHALATFRDYGAFDARTGQALHGLFLIDGRGRVRWQAISAEPFMAVKSLLAEARRTVPLWESAAGAPVRWSVRSP